MEALRKELSVPPKGNFCNKLYFYQAVRPHYGLPPAKARAKGIAGMFRTAPAYVYANDRIAGSFRGIFEEKDTKKAAKIWDSYGFCSFTTNADHFAPDYPTFLKDGIPGTLRRLEEQPENPVLTDMKETLLGFAAMLKNYETAARERGKSQIAEDLAFLQKNPPATFRQALQLVFLTYIAFVLEGRYAMALGRMDQYLYPYYKNISPEEATELLACTFLKLQEHRWLGGDDVVNICIGGVTPTGEDATNPLSYCILEAVRRANIPGPNLSARFHAKTEDRFYEECLKVIGTGLGYPALMNDEVNIPALARHGYAMEDARDYCFVGCIENFLPGKQPPWSDGRFNVPLYLTEILDREYASMEELLQAFHESLAFGMSEYYALFNNKNTRLNPQTFTQPFLSLFCRDCIGRGKDIREGGALYPSVHGAACMGIGTVTDSLAALDQLVFTQKKYTLKEIKAALDANFEGYEILRQELLAAPKYGNDDDRADRYAVWFVEEMERLVSPYRTRDGGAFYTAIAANTQNISAGAEVPATPDGRRAWEPLSDAASPTYGRDLKGITAVIKSTTKPDYTLVSCGTVLNQKLSPNLLKEDALRGKLAALIKVYFARGGQELQINSVSRKVLQEAMEKPEDHKNLTVRVSGFSAYFTDQSKEVQKDILNRTEHEGV
ncbi:MAG: DUF3029 family protein [Clostridia bacterium]|nr:DUF3029 family protein [Clostridia bacterium]